MRENRYLRDKMIGRDSRENRRYDERNPYGAEGGYVSSSRRGRDRAYDQRDYEESDYARRGGYQNRGRDNRDYSREQDYRSYKDYDDYEDRTSNDMYRKYEYDLEEWTEKLKKHDKFKMSKEDIINRARSMGVRFDDYSQEEYLAVYYMLMSDFPHVANDYSTYLHMAKKWLEDDDIEVSPSEKLSIYYYDIVKGECI